ncbi:ERMES complex subunit [Tulasnella sp. 419]|nr:ERMES complex subunit [Tulasnella sp. 419]
MSFQFNWPRFSEQFHVEATQMLNAALNKGNKPRIIADKIEVVELEMGTQPPELEIRDIGELTTDQFRGIFRLTYAGDAHIVLRTKVQANPLNHKKPEMELLGVSRGIVAAHQPLVVPMLLRLSHFRLNAYVVLVVSKQKGITLVFKTDPLQNVDVNSTFDSIAVIQKFIQKEIEGQLREMFREDLPGIIHRLSQRWTAGKAEVKAPYLQRNPTTLGRDKTYHNSPASEVSFQPSPSIPSTPPPGFQQFHTTVGLRPSIVPRAPTLPSLSPLRPRVPTARSLSGVSQISRARTEPLPSPGIPSNESTSSFPDLENYDPTYGLRPEGLPTKSGYSGFGRLFTDKKGLAELGDLAEERSDDGISDDQTFDMIDWGDTAPDYTTQYSEAETPMDRVAEYETIPAVGGGTITRPRVVHSQSQVQLPADAISLSSTRPSQRSRHASPIPSVPPTPFTPSSRVSHFTPSQLHLSTSSTTLPDDEGDPVLAWRNTQYRQSHFNPYFPEMNAAGPSKLGPKPRGPASAGPTGQFDTTRSQHYPYRPFHLSPLSGPSSPYLGGVRSSSSSYTHPSRSSDGAPHTISTPPSSDMPGPDDEPGSPMSGHRRKHSSGGSRDRRRSISPSRMHPFDSLRIGSPPKQDLDPTPAIVLRPGGNTTLSHLSILSQSNHTLSPYTHEPEHFTVRSGLPRHPLQAKRDSSSTGTSDRAKTAKARRKRTFKIGGSSKPPEADVSVPSAEIGKDAVSPLAFPNTEFSEDDMDYYFRRQDGPTPVDASVSGTRTSH